MNMPLNPTQIFPVYTSLDRKMAEIVVSVEKVLRFI